MQRLTQTLLAFCCFLAFTQDEANANTTASEQAPITVQWQINHYPQKYFVETAKKLNALLQESEAGRKLIVNPVVPKNLGWDIEKAVTYTKVGVRNGEYDIAQAYTFTLTEMAPMLRAFDIPYLIESHDHFDKIVESPVGEKLVARLRDFGYEPLAVTYSGGMVGIPSTRPLRTMKDFKGLRFKAWEHQANYETHKVLGTQLINSFAIPRKSDEMALVSAFKLGLADAGDCEIAEFGELKDQPKLYFNLFDHRMLATVLLMNKAAFEKLPVGTQQALKKASVEAARWERQMIADTERELLARMKAEGKNLIYPSAAEKEKMRTALKPVHSFYENQIGKSVMNEIKALKPSSSKLVQKD